MSRTRADVQEAIIRLESALDDLVQALGRDRVPAPPPVDRLPAAWPAGPRGLTGPRRLAPVTLPPARV
jgi:hypothetical protein